MIIPSIDISNGKVVQLRQGKDLVLTDSRPAPELAAEFGRYGPVAVVDLDAALGKGENQDLVTDCCRAARCRVGGGIRSEQAVREWIRRGADKVVIGTQATPEFLSNFPREWIVAAIDAKGDDVVVKGWTEGTGRNVIDQARTLAPYCSEFLFTQVQREGMLGGCDIETAKALRAAVDTPITVAGGITSAEEITQLENLGCNSQLGRAVYEGTLDLTEAWITQIAFNQQGLVPTIVQDADTRDVLMLAYSNADSLKQALTTGQGCYFSRSRNKLWRKGETSGHTQTLVSAAWDCDRDTILFLVNQQGPACHRNLPTCFGDRAHNVPNRLETTLRNRRLSSDERSYTRKLLDDPNLVAAKLREETEEVIEARQHQDIIWESADVIYHLMVRMQADEVTLDEVWAELRSRMKEEADSR